MVAYFYTTYRARVRRHRIAISTPVKLHKTVEQQQCIDFWLRLY